MATQKATSKDNKNQLQDQNRSMSLPPTPEAPYMTVLTKNVIGVIGVICD